MNEEAPSETTSGVSVLRNVYRDTVQSCPDVPADHRAFALFMAWKVQEVKTDRGHVICVIRGQPPAQLAQEFGVGETKAKELLAGLVRNGWLRREQRSAYVLTVPPVVADPDLLIERGYELTAAARMITPWKKKPLSAKHAERAKRQFAKKDSGTSVGTSDDIRRDVRPSYVGTSDRVTSGRPTEDPSGRPTDESRTSRRNSAVPPYSPTPEDGPAPIPSPPAVAAASGGDAAGLLRTPGPLQGGIVADLGGGTSGDDHRTSADRSVAEEVPQVRDARARAAAGVPPWRWTGTAANVPPARRPDGDIWREVAITGSTYGLSDLEQIRYAELVQEQRERLQGGVPPF